MRPSTIRAGAFVVRRRRMSRDVRAIFALAGALAGSVRAVAAPPIDVRIALRLDAPYFEGGAERPATVDVGHDVREVVGRRQQWDLGLQARVPLEGGVARARFEVPADVSSFPPSAFRLGVLKLRPDALPANLAPDKLNALVDTLFTSIPGTLSTGVPAGGWTLHRDAADPSGIIVTAPAERTDATDQVGYLRVHVFEPTPRVLESRPFDVPAGSHVELGYALAYARAAPLGTRADFSAALQCADGAGRDDTANGSIVVGGAGDQRWHEASLPVAAALVQCRLRLTIASSADDAGDPVWATPRLVTSVGDREQVDARSLVLISLDTLRADHLSGFGYPRATSPSIDRLVAGAGTTFTDVSTTYPSTDVAHLSAFTSLYPASQPVLGRLPRAAPVRSFVETLRDAGFDTGAVTEDGNVNAAYGFAHGFDRLRERPIGDVKVGGETFADALRYLREHRRRRFFLFVHTYQIHDPYTPSAAYQSFFREADERGVGTDVPARHRAEFDAYDRGIRETDDLVAHFLDKLRRLGLPRRTYVVLMSDHGEAFGEHVVTGHGFGGQQEQLHVPLIVCGPDIPRGRRDPTHASLVDVAPTVLDLLGAPPLPHAEGSSLAPVLRHPDRPLPVRPLFFEWNVPGAHGVRIGRWKLLATASGEQFFDLDTDPGERTPLASAPEQRAADDALAGYAAARKPRAEAAYQRDLVPAQTERALRALGYVQ